MKNSKDQQGLYFKGQFITESYGEALCKIYELDQLPNGFSVNEDHPANDYSIVDNNGVQHIYDLSPSAFYTKLSDLS